MGDWLRRTSRLAAAFAMAAAVGSGAARGQSASAEPVMIMDPSMRPIIVDPLAAQMLTGTGIPLGRSEAAMAAATSVSRFTGIGSGRISGVRGETARKPGSGGSIGAAAGQRRPTLRSPGGQASVYFNRYGKGTAVSAAAPVSTARTKNYYNRPAGFFPEGVR